MNEKTADPRKPGVRFHAESWDQLAASLEADFPPEQIRYRVGRSGVNDRGPWAVLYPYVDARDLRRRLNEACGRENWQVEHYNAGKGIACRIGIRFNASDSWVWKSDGADATDVEAVKGAFSESFKRAAYAWGVGEYLYDMPTPFAETSTQRQKGEEWKYAEAKDRSGKKVQFWWRPPTGTSDYRTTYRNEANGSNRKQGKKTPPPKHRSDPVPPDQQPKNPREAILFEIQKLLIGKDYEPGEIEALREDCKRADTARLAAIKNQIKAGKYFTEVNVDPDPDVEPKFEDDIPWDDEAEEKSKSKLDSDGSGDNLFTDESGEVIF